MRFSSLCFFVLFFTSLSLCKAQEEFKINDLEYLEMTGLNVMLAHDFYPESHQGGVGIIQNGLRVATNGDLRLEPTPGQWQPVPKVGKRVVDRNANEISVRMQYPDEEKNRKGFNPIIYPDLKFSYNVRIKPEGKSVKIIVDLDEPLPESWVGKVGFNFELFPQILFGKSWYLDQQSGIFQRQANGPMYKDKDGELQIVPMAKGKVLTVAPETDSQRMIIKNLGSGDLELIDGRGKHNNGWFNVRSLVPAGATKNAIEWIITPNAIEGWKYEPVIQVSQVGYHPKQEKVAVIETDIKDAQKNVAVLYKISPSGTIEKVLEKEPLNWGKFLRYNYLKFDFSDVATPGIYKVKYGKNETLPFQISADVYKRNVWQPTLEYFLPAQMCHMRINERYRVWHGACHLDDARMAPINHNHFDGYIQGPSTLTNFKPGDNIPGMAQGGWHDAGDFDLRIESQIETVHWLSLAYEEFGEKYDNTTIDQKNRIVEIQQPDGKADLLQQIEHGVLPIVAGYNALGRLYRGVICPTLRQYVLLGDAMNMTDNKIYNGSGVPDDRWLFTEDYPGRELQVAAGLSAASRTLKGFNDTLSVHCLRIAEILWNVTKEKDPLERVGAAVELLKTTKNKKYADFLVASLEKVVANIERTGWQVGPSLTLVNNKKYTESIREAVKRYRKIIDEREKKSPYGLPYEPDIWGAGWGIQNFGVEQYFLHVYFPESFSDKYMLHAMNFILGCHPGSNTSSFVSGVGAKSLTTAYGFNRADWSYIPGGSASGTALIRPDFPELLTWPFLWQQTEYVLGRGTTDYLFLVLAANKLLK